MWKNKYILILFGLSILFSQNFKPEFDAAHSFEPKFVSPKQDGNHFGVEIDINVKEGYYMLSAKTISFLTEIKWPEKGICTNSLGEELYGEYDQVDSEFCNQENGIFNYGKWIKSQTEISEYAVDGSKKEPYMKGDIKDPLYIQKGKLKTIQEFTLKDDLDDGEYKFEAAFQYQICKDEDGGLCFMYNKKEEKKYSTSPELIQKIQISKDESGDYILNWDGKQAILKNEDIKNQNCELTKSEDDTSLIVSFFTAILAGLIAIITPCVFPMIPMTVAFFSKDAKKGSRESIKTGILFGISIVVIFTIVGVLFSAIFGAQLANELATSAIANIIFAIIFLIFAISFFGYFEIRIPNKLLNKINKKADGGGLLGIFFMALTLVLVSFSCTAPIVGTVMIDAVAGNFLKPIIVMLGFSLAFAVPFSLFAIFPSWLESLPQSGGWLNSVKVVLGFLELALALKFLSMPDQAYHWGLLSRETFLIMWIIIFGAMGLYLLGYIKFENDSKIEKFSLARISSATITFAFCIYMLSGLYGNSVSALAGIIPPAKERSDSTVKYSDILSLPSGFDGYFDYDDAIENAVKQNKPLFIDFTGHACFNCRRMEENVWIHPDVKKILNEDYVIVALYVDDKTPLIDDGKYKTLGDKNFALQMDEFCSNAQPFYVLLDPVDKTVLATPVAYDTNIQNFVDFLNEGKKEFYKK